MKAIKKYTYPYKYFTNILNLNVEKDSIIGIEINVKTNNVKIFQEGKEIKSFSDSGQMVLFLKALGRFVIMAKIVVEMENECYFDVSDKFDDTIGFSKVHTLGNDYVVVGGYNHWSELINIDNVQCSKREEFIVSAIVQYYFRYGFIDVRSMYIRVPYKTAVYMPSVFFKKPYVYIAN